MPPLSKRHCGGRPCSVCEHPDRGLIERAKLDGLGTEAVAAKYGVSTDAVYRHMRRHLSQEAKEAYASEHSLKALAKRAADDNLTTLDRYRVINGYLMTHLQRAADHNDRAAVGTLSRAAFEGLRDLARLTGETLEHVGNISLVQNNFYASPDYLALEAMLVQRLVPHPAAMKDVLDGLAELNGSTSEAPKLIELNPAGRDDEPS